MLSVGSGTVFVLYEVPNHVDILLLFSNAISYLISTIQNMIRLFYNLIQIIIIASLVIFSALMISGGLWRLIRLLRRIFL